MFRRKGKGTPQLVSITPKGTQYGDANIAAAERLRAQSMDLMDAKSPGSDRTRAPRMQDAGKSKSLDDPVVPTVNDQDGQRKLTPSPRSHSPAQASPSGSPHHHSHNIKIIPLMEPKRQSPTHLQTPSRSPRPVSWQGEDIHIIPLMEPKQPVPPPSLDRSSPVINRVKKSHSSRPISWHPQALANRTSPKHAQQPPEVKIIPLMTPKISHATTVSSTTSETPGDSHKKTKPKETVNSPLGPPITSAETPGDSHKKTRPKETMNSPLGPPITGAETPGDSHKKTKLKETTNSPLGPPITGANDRSKQQNKAHKKATIDSPIGPMVIGVDDKDLQRVGHRSMDRHGGLGPAPISFEEY